MLIGSTETVYGQRLTHPKCKGIHYTDTQDKRALECILNSTKKDSLISNMSLQIVILKQMNNVTKEKSKSFETHYNEEKSLSKRLQEDLDKSKKWNNRLLIGGPLVGLFVGVLIRN